MRRLISRGRSPGRLCGKLGVVCRISYANELWLGCLFLGHAPVQAMPVRAMFSTVLFNLRMSNSLKPRLMAFRPTKYASGRIGTLTLNACREEAATLVCTVTGTVLSLLVMRVTVFSSRTPSRHSGRCIHGGRGAESPISKPLDLSARRRNALYCPAARIARAVSFPFTSAASTVPISRPVYSASPAKNTAPPLIFRSAACACRVLGVA
jgi:hypothetical protein